MLSDEILEKVSERLANRIENANEYILKTIGNNIDEIGKLTYTDAHKLAQVMKYGGDYDKIVKKLAETTTLNEKDIEKIFNEVARSDYEFAKQFYDFKNIKYIPYDENYALKSQVNTIANIVKRDIRGMMNPSVLGYGMVDTTTGKKTFKGLKQAYYDLIDEAVISVGQGKETFNEAMSRQIKEMGGGGLKVIYDSTYVNKEGKVINRTRRLDSAVRMNMKDGLRTLHNETQETFGNEFGANGVEVSVHQNPAEDHEDMQGRQFSKEEYEKLQSDGVAKDYTGKEIDIHRTLKDGTSTVDFRPVSQYNCYHYTFSIVLGVSNPEYSEEQLQKIIDDNNKGFELDGKHYTNYQGTQMQRRLETEIRKQKDIQIMAKASGQTETVAEAQKKIRELTSKYKELSSKAGLPTKMDRMRVSGYKRVKVDMPKQQSNNEIINKTINTKYYNYEELKLDDDIYLDYFEFGDKDIKELNLTKEQENAYHYFYDFKTFNKENDVSEALEDYTNENAEFNYRKLNWQLRNDKVSTEAREKINLISQGINENRLPENMILYRGITTENNINRYMQVGDIVDEKGFLSTTLYENEAKEFMMDKYNAVLEIEAEKGTPSIYIGEQTMSMTENNEILFDRNTKLKVISISTEEDIKRIKVKMIK